MSQTPFELYLKEGNLDSKPHQTTAVNWCLDKESKGTECDDKSIYGGLIADEMGLGKTIQMVGTMVSNPLPKTLIVLPRVLIEQWIKFLEKTTNLKLYLYHGSKRELSNEEIQKYQIVITTYGLVANKTSRLHQISWDRIVFDEAHHMRNSKTKIFKGAITLKGSIRWLMTGTPIQNTKKDFYSLCEQMSIPKSFYTKPENLKYIAKNLILKRTKAEANIKLPPIKYHTASIAWENQAEQELAEEIHSQLAFSNIDANKTRFKMGSSFGEFKLPLLVRARQACIYPPLLKDKIKMMIRTNMIDCRNNKELEKMLLEATDYSSKITNVANKIIENKDNDKRKLVFCHYRGEIDILQEQLEKIDMNVEIFDGRTNSSEREKILQDKDIDVLILQIQTGCEGLNLQHFNEIYFVSPHWNPAVEDQAIARAHRIGQEKETHIYRFKMGDFDERGTTHTLDQYSQEVQKSKRHLLKLIE